MKRLTKILLSAILSCLMIAGGITGTNAAHTERMKKNVVYQTIRCSGDRCSQLSLSNAGCPANLSDLLRRAGVQEEVCRQILEQINRYSCPQTNPCDNQQPCVQEPTESVPPAGQPTAPEPTIPRETVQPPAPSPTQPPSQPMTQAPTQPPTQLPTQAPTLLPTQAPTQPPETQPLEPITEDSAALSPYEQEVIRLINEIRAQYGLGTLQPDLALSRVARLKSQDMHDLRYFSHTSPTYGSPFEMMKRFGIRYRTAGENIAMGYATPRSVVDGWMNSEGHRKNILNPSFTQIGMGYVESGHYWTQMFIG